jgi:hypothetical protein
MSLLLNVSHGFRAVKTVTREDKVFIMQSSVNDFVIYFNIA